jgi:hypothetical protein
MAEAMVALLLRTLNSGYMRATLLLQPDHLQPLANHLVSFVLGDAFACAKIVTICLSMRTTGLSTFMALCGM